MMYLRIIFIRRTLYHEKVEISNFLGDLFFLIPILMKYRPRYTNTVKYRFTKNFTNCYKNLGLYLYCKKQCCSLLEYLFDILLIINRTILINSYLLNFKISSSSGTMILSKFRFFISSLVTVR